eukprot:Pgem_evm1s14471
MLTEENALFNVSMLSLTLVSWDALTVILSFFMLSTDLRLTVSENGLSASLEYTSSSLTSSRYCSYTSEEKENTSGRKGNCGQSYSF